MIPASNACIKGADYYIFFIRKLTVFNVRSEIIKPLEPAACVFLGYPPGVKGYKLYDISSKSFIVSRDVVFHESYFPFHSIDSETDTLDPFPDIVLPKSLPDQYDLNPTQCSSTLINNRRSAQQCDVPNVEPISAHSFNHTQNQQSPNNSDSSQPLLRRTTRVGRPPSYL